MRLPTLVVVHEQGTSRRLPIEGNLVVGRDPANEVALDDGYLSRRHCQISYRNGHVLVRDLGSYNGTYVNGQRIHEECYVLPGDVLKMGRTRLFVDFGEEEQSGSLRIYAPNLVDKKGVQQVSLPKPPALAAAYQKIEAAIPPPVAADPLSSADLGPATRPQRRVSPDDKTPIPLPAIEDSAVARASASQRPGSQRDADRANREAMRVIAQITRVLSGITDIHDFLDYVLSRVLSVIPAERGLIMRLDPQRRGLYPEVVRSALPERTDDDARRLGISHTIAKKVIRERVSILVNDAVLDQRFKQASSVQELQIRSILCAPLWLGEQISGLIYLDHLLHAYAFSESDRDLLVAAANLAALGIERSLRI